MNQTAHLACINLMRQDDWMETPNKSTEERLTALEKEVGIILRTMATKDDIAQLRADIVRIDATLAAMQTNMQTNFTTKADLAQLEVRIMRWMIATLIGVAGMNATLVLIVVKLLHV